MSLLKYHDVDCKKIQYTKPEKTGAFYYSTMSYGKTSPIHLQSPKMKCRLSGSDIMGKHSPTLDLEPLSNDFSFYDKLLSLDDRNIKETFNKNNDWFGKDIPLELIDDMYKRTTKPVKKECKPNFSFKLPITKGKVQCPIYDQNRACLDIEKITEDCELIVVLHIRGLKFLKQHYYCDMYISQIKVCVPKEQRYMIPDTYIIEDEEEDNDILDSSVLQEIEEGRLRDKRVSEIKIELEGKKLSQETLVKGISHLERELEGLQTEFA
jgi:hypothetical protein